jgi:hypothetical protein
MHSARLIPLALVATALVGCGGYVPERPPQTVVANVTIYVPNMT